MANDVAGEWIVRASIWLALLCYPAGSYAVLLERPLARRLARLARSLGCAAFLIHVLSAFDVFYLWSHEVALRETARQVGELTGRPSGAGLYLNYLFTIVWLLDAAWWWRDAERYRRRSALSLLLLHGFFLFIIFNATVVFEDGAMRLFGLAVTIVGCIGLAGSVRRARVTR